MIWIGDSICWFFSIFNQNNLFSFQSSILFFNDQQRILTSTFHNIFGKAHLLVNEYILLDEGLWDLFCLCFSRKFHWDSLLQDDMHKIYMNTLYARTPHLSSYPLASGIITGILLSAMSHWTPNKRVKSSWEYIMKRKHGESTESRFKNLCSSKASEQVQPWHCIRFEPRVIIKPRWAKWSDFSTIFAGCICAPCVLRCPPPHPNTHKHMHRLLIFNSPSNLQHAQMHSGTTAKTCMHEHIALKWAPLTVCGEGVAVMQRQGPYTGLHAHCLGIITSNSNAQWFWQAQGWAITAWRGQEWLCWAMTT